MIQREQKAVKYIFTASAVLPVVLPVIKLVVAWVIPRWSTYLEINYWDADAGGIIVLWLLEIAICGILYFRGLKKNKETFVAVSCTLFYVSLELMGLSLTMLSRIALWFRPFLMGLFTIFPGYLKGKWKLLYEAVLIALLLLLFFSYIRTDTRQYQFYWQSD